METRRKVKHRETREVVVGGVLGSISHPEVVIGGLYTTDGELVVVGRTVALKPDQAERVLPLDDVMWIARIVWASQ